MQTALQQTTKDFFLALYNNVPADHWLTFWISAGKQKHTQWLRVGDVDTTDLAAFDRADYYYSVCPADPFAPDAENKNKRIKKTDVSCIPAFFMDVDTLTDDKTDHDKKDLPESIEDAVAGLNALPLPPSALVSSGRGLHAYWLLDTALEKTPKSAEALKDFAKAVALATGWTSLDTHASEPSRVLRIPGTQNHKSPDNPLEVKLLHLDASTRYAAADLLDWAKTQAGADPVFQQVDMTPTTGIRADAQIIELCRIQTKSGEDFARLYDHGSSGDNSAADYQLCRLLAYWTQDFDQIDRIFRSSALCRDKWTDREDYRTRTITNAQRYTQARRAQTPVIRDLSAEIAGGGGDYNKDRPYLTYQNFVDVLFEQNINIRRNVISGETEFTGLPNSFSRESLVNIAPPHIRMTFLEPAFKGADRPTVEELIMKHADLNRYNPVTDYLEGLQLTSFDALSWLLDDVLCLDESDQLSRVLVTKWLHECVALAFNGEDGKCYGGEGVLTLQGEPRTGKTSFFENIVPDQDWQRSGVQINMDDKDTQLNALTTWIVELGEADEMLKREQSSLKAFITQRTDRIRVPYGRAAVSNPRRTCFGASVNEKQFLRDPTGSRRWWTIPITNYVNWELLKDRSKLNQIWAIAYQMYKRDPQGFRLTGRETDLLNRRNGQYETGLPGEDEIMTRLDFDKKEWCEVTTTQLREYLGCTATTEQLGRALTKLARDDKRIKQIRKASGRYWLLPHFYTSSYTPPWPK